MKRNFIIFFQSVLFLFAASSCTLYKSSDRDFFNSNGKSGAPASAALKPISRFCQRHQTNTADSSPIQGELVEMSDDGLKMVLISQISATKPESFIRCRFVYESSVNDTDSLSLSRSLVEQFDLGNLDLN